MSEEKPLWSMVSSCTDEGCDPNDQIIINCFESDEWDYKYDLRDSDGCLLSSRDDREKLEELAVIYTDIIAKEKGWLKHKKV